MMATQNQPTNPTNQRGLIHGERKEIEENEQAVPVRDDNRPLQPNTTLPETEQGPVPERERQRQEQNQANMLRVLPPEETAPAEQTDVLPLTRAEQFARVVMGMPGMGSTARRFAMQLDPRARRLPRSGTVEDTPPPPEERRRQQEQAPQPEQEQPEQEGEAE